MRRRQAFAAKAEGRPRPPQPPAENVRETYARVFGKPPHHRMKDETIRERLKAHGHPE